MVSNRSCSRRPAALAFSRSTSARICGTLIWKLENTPARRGSLAALADACPASPCTAPRSPGRRGPRSAAEAADGAQPLHRRRREDGDEARPGWRRTSALQRGGDGRWPIRSWRAALVERLQRHEDDAGIRAVGEAVDRQAGKGHRVARRPAACMRDVAPCLRITASVRSSVAASGSCAKATRYCLSCGGTKPVGVFAKATAGQADQHRHRPPARCALARSTAPTPRT